MRINLNSQFSTQHNTAEPTMRWGRKRTQNSAEKKSFSLSDLLSFSWLSKLRSNNKTQTNTSPKSKCVSNNPIPSTKLNAAHDVFAPRRRSVGDEDRALRNRNNHRRHYSVGGDHFSAASSITLGHAIPFSVTPKQKRNSPVLVSPLYREMADPGLHSHKVNVGRRRRLKRRLAIAASDDSRRKSFHGKIKIRGTRYQYDQVGVGSVEQGRKGLENFAVVKRSREPERDFKKSMVEMIVEKEMRQREELESLLACYLTLNADEHHDVIVKVFRQVCFQINRKQYNL